MATTIEPGVYRNGTGHTIVINDEHPKDLPIPDGYERIASEEEFATGEFHPWALPGQEPAGWTPEAGDPAVPAAPGGGISPEQLEETVQAAVAEALKKAAATQKKAIDDAVAKALEAATK